MATSSTGNIKNFGVLSYFTTISNLLSYIHMNDTYLHHHKEFQEHGGSDFLRKKNYLATCIEDMNLSHAYLFLGSPYSHKEDLFEWFIQGIPHSECMRIIPDEELSRVGIENIRVCKDTLSKTSLGGGMRIVIIEDVKNITHEASNALLKILEEPDDQTLFCLMAHNEYQVLPTILSRCQHIRIDTLPDTYHNRSDVDALQSLVFSQPLWNQLEYGKNLSDKDIIVLEQVLHEALNKEPHDAKQALAVYNQLILLRKREQMNWSSSNSRDMLFLPHPL